MVLRIALANRGVPIERGREEVSGIDAGQGAERGNAVKACSPRSVKMMRFLTRATFQWVVTIAVPLLAFVGCASERELYKDTERMLIAAGFQVEPADTPEKLDQLKALPPHTLVPVRVGAGETIDYVYADPDVCHCLLVGNQKAYQAFGQLVVSKPPGSFRPIP